MYEQKNQTTKKNFKKQKRKQEKNRNKINSGLYIPRRIQFKATRPEGCSKKEKFAAIF